MTYIDAAAIRADAEAMLAKAEKPNPGLFQIKSANEWMREAAMRPMPEELFGQFWFEGELCILFADTNVGKSILAVQIAEAISSGRPITGVRAAARPLPVLYFDFELTDKQFQIRYTCESSGQIYLFSEGLNRCEIDPDSDIDPEFADFDAYLHCSLEAAVVTTGAKILVIDNLTYLKNETERAKDALPLMKYLKGLKAKYGLSILALAHTPKRDHSKPIGRNDLQGSKMLINFCDSAFAIGESTVEPALRYLKQIKCRNAEIKFGADNVLLCQVTKFESFLKFEIAGNGSEGDHLRQVSDGDRRKRDERILELNLEGVTQRDIAKELKVSVGTVNRIIKNVG